MIRDVPILALTPGEPAGIGPECTIRLAHEHPELRLIAVADPDLLKATATTLNLDVPIHTWKPGQSVVAGQLSCYGQKLAQKVNVGQTNPANAAYVVETIKSAVRLVRGGHAGALVTGPVHKGVINDGGIAFSGHTELLADLAGIKKVVMMLAADELRVALVTTHLALRDVADAITYENVYTTIRITHQELGGRFGIQ